MDTKLETLAKSEGYSHPTGWTVTITVDPAPFMWSCHCGEAGGSMLFSAKSCNLQRL